MKKFAPLLPIMLAATLDACQLTSEPTLTTVEGIVTNQYTGLPVMGVPVSVTRNTYFLFGGSYRDSVTSALSDANGHYLLALDLAPDKKYLASVLYSRNYYDLTFHPYDSVDNGAILAHGKANQVNIKVTDYKRVTVKANSTKVGKSNISFDFLNADGDYYSGTVFTDTVRANQQVSFSQVVKVLPNRKYNFTKITVNRIGQGYTATYFDYARTAITRTVLYNDTTTVIFR